MGMNLNNFAADDEVAGSLGEHLATHDESELLVAPAARNLAEKLGINLLDIPQGSGQNGRILKADVEAFHKGAPDHGDGPEFDGFKERAGENLPDLPLHPTQQPGAKQFSTKMRINLNGKRYQLTDILTDSFGAIELVFDELS